MTHKKKLKSETLISYLVKIKVVIIIIIIIIIIIGEEDGNSGLYFLPELVWATATILCFCK
jgi:hypothetical protein